MSDSFATPWTVVHEAPLSLEFFRQGYWIGLPFPTPRHLPDPGIKPVSLCNPMNHSTPGLPVHHQFPDPTQTHIYLVGDAIQPSHLLSSPSPPVFNLSQHQGFFLLLLFFKFYFIFKLYIIVLVLPNIKMNPPQAYMCSPS